MKIVTLESLKLFLNYLQKNFTAPFATRDGDGNKITDTYLRAHAEAASAATAKKADTAAECTGNAASSDVAGKLKTPRQIRLSGDIAGSADFDGSEDVVLHTTVTSVEAVTSGLDELRKETSKKFKETDAAMQNLETEVSTNLTKKIEDGDSNNAAALEEAKTNFSNELNLDIKKINDEAKYSQVTKLNTSTFKGVDLPVKLNADYLRRPFQVLKLYDDGTTLTTADCAFPNNDAKDFANAGDVYDFRTGGMRLKMLHKIPMAEQVKLGEGYVSNTDFIDLSDYTELKEVSVH